jgi:hypothetical protein
VNPQVPHPRWSQANERLIGTDEQRPTLLFNGYGDYVASLYTGLEKERLWTRDNSGVSSPRRRGPSTPQSPRIKIPQRLLDARLRGHDIGGFGRACLSRIKKPGP